jgi:hypothetical protein
MTAKSGQILLSADARVLEASRGALKLLDMTLDELRQLPRGSLSLAEERAAARGFEEAWQDSGRRPIFGTGTIRLPVGRLQRVRYLVTPLADGTYEVILEPAAEPVSDPPRTYTIGAVLSAWRAAERQLAALPEDDPEWARVQDEIEHLRSEYHRLARAHQEREAVSGDN